MNNESAIEFYKKFGFEIVETKEHYYKRIEPADAHVLQKDLKKTTSNHSQNICSTATSNCQANQQQNGIDAQINSNNHHNHHHLQGKSKA